MRDIRDLIIKGIREEVSQSQNTVRTFDVQQGKEEGPAEFLNRLKERVRKYSGLDVGDPLHFVTNSRPDIAKKKLQKLKKLER
jgi:hypothetical protein